MLEIKNLHVNVDGKDVQVEFGFWSSIKNFGKKIWNGVKNVGKCVGRVYSYVETSDTWVQLEQDIETESDSNGVSTSILSFSMPSIFPNK